MKTQTRKSAPKASPVSRTRRKIRPEKAAPAIPVTAAPAPLRHNDVRQRAMLVNLTVHQWLANTTDERITDDVARQHGIAADMGKYQKNLLSKAALEKLRSAGNRLRTIHNRLTLPWDEWGTRILSAKAFLEYNAAVRQGIDEFDQIFRDELEAIGSSGKSKYEEAKDEAKRLLNGAFREEDYPTAEQLKRKFRAKITVMPIPAAADFRIDLGAEATDQVRQEIEARANDRVAEAMKGVFERVQGVVAKIATALKAEKTESIRKTLFTSAEAVLDALPLLNVTGDPALDSFAAEIRQMLSGLDAKGLRESESLRASVCGKADSILAKMNDFFGDD